MRARAKSGQGATVALAALLGALAFGCGRTEPTPSPSGGDTPDWSAGVELVATYPHDPSAFTQGLLWHAGALYESTGRLGSSSVRRVALESGKVLEQRDLVPRFFGEGLALVDERLIQLTWQDGIAFAYRREGFEPDGHFEYAGEGWGLTYDGEHLIQSDGTNALVFRDPATFAEVRRVQVFDEGRPIWFLNELEMVQGEVWANVWKSDVLARIDPADGHLLGTLDLSKLRASLNLRDPDAVLNGIAYDPASGRLFVTGKLWPKLFELRPATAR